ncbi:MAG: UDP-N-acetylmuramoyl-tripeptide--D-alanyl-D-alanine ligase, partial [Treponema sp.]|nr:UDP-N-acetylmuramoyl-tripeptide--D-alanyl-D-alanine ligase [Treponema sp.]
VATDSRKVVSGSLFVPLVGEKQDGHSYIPQAIEKGASAVFVDRRNYAGNTGFFTSIFKKNPSVTFIGVDNTLHALQSAAARYVDKFPNLIKIAVTGSSGKTTTKELALALLSQKYRVIANEGNLNSETGLPLSVFNIRKGHEIGIFEMGMNRKDEMKEISAVLKPHFAVITNIGTAHIGILGSRQAIAEEKAHVFDHFSGKGVAFIPKDDDFASFLAGKVDGTVVYYGAGLPSNVQFVKDRGLSGTDFIIEGKPVTLSLPGSYNYRNALAAISLAQHLSLSTDEIISGFASLKPLFGRSELITDEKSGIRIVQDCYNANPDSMEKAIGLLASDGSGSHFLALGDMLELGEASLESHRRVISAAIASGASILLFGRQMSAALESMKGDLGTAQPVCYPDSSDVSFGQAAAWLTARMSSGDAVLIKGSRGMAMERLTALLVGGGNNV